MWNCLQVVCRHIFFVWFLGLKKRKTATSYPLRGTDDVTQSVGFFPFPSHSFVRRHVICFSGSNLEAVSSAVVTGDEAII